VLEFRTLVQDQTGRLVGAAFLRPNPGSILALTSRALETLHTPAVLNACLRRAILLGIILAVFTHTHTQPHLAYSCLTFSIDSCRRQRILTKSAGQACLTAGTSNQTTSIDQQHQRQHQRPHAHVTYSTTCRQHLLTFKTLTHPSSSTSCALGLIFYLDFPGSGLPLTSHNGFPRPRSLGL